MTSKKIGLIVEDSFESWQEENPGQDASLARQRLLDLWLAIQSITIRGTAPDFIVSNREYVNVIWMFNLTYARAREFRYALVRAYSVEGHVRHDAPTFIILEVRLLLKGATRPFFRVEMTVGAESGNVGYRNYAPSSPDY